MNGQELTQRGSQSHFAVVAMRAVLVVAALCLLLGAVLQLMHQGRFEGWPTIDSTFLQQGAMRGFRHLLSQFSPASGRFWLALGLLMILAAQLLRLGLVLWRFSRGRDRLYVVLTLFLLLLVLRSFFL